MSGGQFWAVVALSIVILGMVYLVGFKDGMEDERTRQDLSRRYS